MTALRGRVDPYERMARWYDVMTSPMEWLGGRRRRHRVISQANGRTLEIGIGTGINLSFYQRTNELIGLDASRAMLERAQAHARELGREVTLVRGDAEALPFPDESFDSVVATCVFCSVDDPVRGLREALRVVRADGRVFLLEHVRPRNWLLGMLADTISPLTRRLLGPEVNRRTEDNVATAGLATQRVRREGVWREIVAGRPKGSDGV